MKSVVTVSIEQQAGPGSGRSNIRQDIPASASSPLHGQWGMKLIDNWAKARKKSSSRESRRLLCFLIMLITLAVALAQERTKPETAVTGRIAIKNPKAHLRDGRPDAGGVAVWLTPLTWKPASVSTPPPRVRIEQEGKRFVPHVVVVQLGTEIDFPNRDPFFHNVFSVYDGKRFDLGLYAEGESRPVRFDRPGISYIFCNIHSQMSAVVLTVATPYFAVSASDGWFSIGHMPAGKYELRLWHERCDEEQLAALISIVSVEPAGTDLGLITLDESGYMPKPHTNKHGREYDREQDMSPYPGP